MRRARCGTSYRNGNIKNVLCFKYFVWISINIFIFGNRTATSVGAVGNIPHDGRNDANDHNHHTESSCGLYLAESSIAYGGWGVFAGRDYHSSEIISVGGLGIPFLDSDMSDDTGNLKEFLINAAHVGGFNEGNQVLQFITGIRPLINYHASLHNVQDGGLKRIKRNPKSRSSVTAGSFTEYHDVSLIATKFIPKGSELFLDASWDWYKNARVPNMDEYARADRIWRHLLTYRMNHPDITEAQWIDILYRIRTEMLTDGDVEGIIARLIPHDVDELDLIQTKGGDRWNLVEREWTWIQNNGKCLDNIREGSSALSESQGDNVGRGAFATRDLMRGSVITPVPLVHVLDRSRLFLKAHSQQNQNPINSTVQLLINYCFSHSASEVVLCPTTNAALINHGGQKANAEIRWSKASKNRLDVPSHLWEEHQYGSTDDLRIPLAFQDTELFDNNTKLMFDIVATRDITAGEEILLDYGSEWETAYANHKREWQPQSSTDYIPADTVANELGDSSISHHHAYECRLEPRAQENRDFEIEEDYFSNPNIDPSKWPLNTQKLYDENKFSIWFPCEILEKNDDGSFRANVFGKEHRPGKIIRKFGNLPAQSLRLVDKPYRSDMHLPSAFRYFIPIPDAIFPLRWRNDYVSASSLNLGAVSKGLNLKLPENRHYHDEHEERVRRSKCGIYFAPSNIPNAGFGTYTAVPLMGTGIVLGTSMPVVPVYHDFPDPWNGADYVWNGIAYNAEWEGVPHVDTAVMAVNDGALANSFIGLVNEIQEVPEYNPVLDRCKDPGAGAFSDYVRYSFTSSMQLGAGEELFVSYGEAWFTGRSQFSDVPMTKNWNDSNRIISSIYGLTRQANSHLNEKQAMGLLDVAKETILKAHRSKTALSTASSLARIEQIVNRNGTAQATVESRSQEWFEKHGQCLDHLYVKQSTVRQAGGGAFSRRHLTEGQVVLSAPLMTTFGDHQMRVNVSKTESDVNEYQLFLNYQFSHPNSSVYFFPINHAFMVNHNSRRMEGGQEPNAELRWSEWNKKSSYFLQRPMEDLKKEKYSTISFDIVALRDIAVDEEVFIDYGIEWENAWKSHVKTWTSPCKTSEVQSSKDVEALNQDKFDSTHYQWTSFVMTVCFQPPRWSGSIHVVKTKEDIEKHENAMVRALDIDWHHDGWKYTRGRLGNRKPCRVIASNQTTGLFDVLFFTDEQDESTEARVLHRSTEMTVDRVQFIHRPFMSDMHHPAAFRHAIKIPDSIFPSQWKDLL